MLRSIMVFLGLSLAACSDAPPPCKGPITMNSPRIQALTKVSVGSIALSTRDIDANGMAGVWAHRFDDQGNVTWSKRLYTGPAAMRRPYAIGAIEQQPGILTFLVGSQLIAFDDTGNPLWTTDVGVSDALALFPSTLLRPGAPPGPARVWYVKPATPTTLSSQDVNLDGTLGVAHDAVDLGIQIQALQYLPMNGGLIVFSQGQRQTVKVNVVGTPEWHLSYDTSGAVLLPDGILFAVVSDPNFAGGGIALVKVSSDGTQMTTMASIPASDTLSPQLLTTTGLAGAVDSARMAPGTISQLLEDVAWYGLDGTRAWTSPSPFVLGNFGPAISDGQGGGIFSGSGTTAACGDYPYDDFFQLLQFNAAGTPGWTSKVTP